MSLRGRTALAVLVALLACRPALAEQAGEGAEAEEPGEPGAGAPAAQAEPEDEATVEAEPADDEPGEDRGAGPEPAESLEPAPGEGGTIVGPEVEPEPAETERAAARTAWRSRATVGDPERVAFSLPGELALRFVWQSDLELSAVPTDRAVPEENLMDDNLLGQNLYLLSWLRLRPELRFLGRFRLIGQIDLLHGHLAGDDTHDVEAARDARSDLSALSSEGVRPRWLYLEWDTGYGVLRAGQMGSHWGLGLLANDGDHADSYLFGDRLFGDIVERIVFATKPFYNLFTCPMRELAVVVGGDLVFDDGIADLIEGDMAWQFVFALMLRLDAMRAAGLYVAYRNQTYADGDHLEVTAIDGYVQWGHRLAHQVTGYLEAEVVGVVGRTDSVPNLEHLEADVRQLGAAARLGVRLESIGLDLRVEGGFASGDADTTDDVIGRFTFDADYRVGLIMFPEMLAWSTARAAVLAGHPELVGEPQDGVELLPTNGAVSGAAYVYPSVTWSPLDWLDVRFAVLIGQATADVTSPLETKRRGRAASFRGGLASSRDLGLEIDLGVFARFNFDYVQLRAGLEGAWFSPGHAFDDAEGERHPDVGLVRTRLQLDW